MKTLKRISLVFTIIFAFSICLTAQRKSKSNTVILPLSETVTLREGSIVYALPRTVFTVNVEMERTIEIPGPYAKYAADLLGLTNVTKNETESWSIVSVKLNSSEEVDPSEYYVITSNTLFQTNILSLKKEGLILDLNPSVSRAGSYILDNSESTSGDQAPSFDLGSDEYFQLKRDTAYKRVSLDSTFIRIPYIVEKKKLLTLDQLAEKAAKRLMEIREGKHLILTGEATVFPQNDAALNEMNRIEKELTELFTGKTIKETRSFASQIIPEKEMTGKAQLLFRFSELTGPVASGITEGKPVTIEFVPEQKTKDITFLNRPSSDKSSSDYDKLYYRMPDVVKMKINMGNEQLLSSRRLIYQFGHLFHCLQII